MTQLAAPAVRQHEREFAEARGAIYRLAAVALSYPMEETWEALTDGRLQEALNEAWQTLGGEPWPRFESSPTSQDLQVGYMATFVHGKRGKPRVPLVASAYDSLVGGLTPGAYLLNVQAFYTHFGLTAAVDDEGHKDQPDHLIAMLEFCALLCHLEVQALENQRDAAPYRRAQRDFLVRYLRPLLQTIRAKYAHENQHGLDANLAHLVKVLPDWTRTQQLALENQVGPCPEEGARKAGPETTSQPMWD
ncbi:MULTISPECIES: molecular chaperone TorD family protein [Marinobacter]|uniref:Molecular chaperone TorD family protein n=1 Tax=Marinobacter xiaoshiensis TaxID=3073652 RepID=A0ABU2HE48_9GAMM|nr:MULTISPECIES: molecular chaperone TorD family protein [unclassified Marinobacter]MBK1872550.1 molecular chaperone TorD family protein [Marinobacter sp. 1-3A]MBK1887430.1 molecular chaperone TorD family protein [Marinobacter sp. DY40_1A1]MDS1309013.1 molecular chaperone TorD family protein [Marinobacter sp. F60267]